MSSEAQKVEDLSKWEYMQLNRKTEEYLINDMNKLGEEGWELVAITRQKDAKSGMGAGVAWVAFLKRPYTGTIDRHEIVKAAAKVAAPVAGEEAPKADESSESGESGGFDFDSDAALAPPTASPAFGLPSSAPPSPAPPSPVPSPSIAPPPMPGGDAGGDAGGETGADAPPSDETADGDSGTESAAEDDADAAPIVEEPEEIEILDDDDDDVFTFSDEK